MPFNPRNIRESIRIILSVSILCIICSGCFTGVESTPKIGKAEVKHQNAANMTPEQLLLADVGTEPFDQWQKGKQFFVTDPKVGVIFSTGSVPVSLKKGDILTFVKAEEVASPVGNAVDLYLETINGEGPLIYRVNAPLEELKQRQEVEIPFTVERMLPDKVGRKLIGKQFYVITPRWYDIDENMVTRVKYIPVKILDVAPGNGEFPIKVLFKPEYKTFGPDDVYELFMTVGNTSRASRNFDSLFSLGNPRNRYPAIIDDNWTAIIENRVLPGMTREEARLALGSPIDVDRGHDYSSIYERWVYDGGVYLIFRDGILESFRR